MSAIGISAEESVAFLQAQGSRIEHRRLGSAWSALDAVQTRQAEAEFESPPADFHSVEMCLSGGYTGRNEFGGLAGSADCRYRPGALFLIPAGRPAQVSIRDGEATILRLMIDRAVMDGVKREMLGDDADRVELLGFNAVFNARMRSCALAIHRDLRNPSAGGAMVADVMAQALCVEIVRRWTTWSAAPPAVPATLTPGQLARAIEAIDAGLEENSGLPTIAAAAGLSPFLFNRAFKATTGQSPHQVLTERRLARACAMLEGPEDLAEIAYACGFSSQSHMTTVFTRQLGLTPGRYRKEQQG